MNWVEINLHTGNREYNLPHEDVVRITTAHRISDGQSKLRDKFQPFETEHHWYRLMTNKDSHVVIQLAERIRRAWEDAWGSYIETVDGRFTLRPRTVQG